MKSLYCVLSGFLFISTLQAEEFKLPFEGVWFVAQGGDTVNVNHHMQSNAQAYGVDFAKVGGNGGRALTKSNGTELADFYSWSQSVLSPADGMIVKLVDGFPDNELGDRDEKNIAGNYLVLRTSANRHVILAHFKNGSFAVKMGEKISQGQLLGLVGNSGNSNYPHIHMHVQSEEEFGKGIGLNIVFGPINVQLSGKQFEDVAWPMIRGLFVSNYGAM